MGGRGSGGSKPRKPSHLRALEGQREDRLNRDEPIPADLPIRPPVELPPDAQDVWNRLVPDLAAKRVMTAWDCDMFAAYCLELSAYYRAAAEVERDGASTERKYEGKVVSPAARVKQNALDNAKSLASRFGLTPADRASLKVGDDGGAKSGAARLLG